MDSHDGALPRASLADTCRVVVSVLAPIVAQGVIARRPRVVRWAEFWQVDGAAVRLLQRLRARYGEGPLRLRIPGRSVALVLDSTDVHHVLSRSPEPFALANAEKRGALERFQPRGVLVSHGRARRTRRRFNEEVLDTGHAVHARAGQLGRRARDEARDLRTACLVTGELNWAMFSGAWRRTIRRVVLGDAARDDTEVSDLLTAMRYDANWSYLAPRRSRTRREFEERLRAYVRHADPNSLAGAIAESGELSETEAVEQIPQWLFASDPACMAAYRALALLSTHGPERDAVRREIAEHRDDLLTSPLPMLRSCVLDSVRLWPTTAVVLRDSTAATRWQGTTLPARTAFVIVSAFFHRDDQRVDQANRFDPRAWLSGRANEDWSLLPFSSGPGRCPGRDLVLFLTSVALATLLEDADYALRGAERLAPDRPLPHDLDPFSLRFIAKSRNGEHPVVSDTGVPG